MSTSAMVQSDGRLAAIEAGYGTVRRPSERPPTQSSVCGSSLSFMGDDDACWNATRRSEYLCSTPTCAMIASWVDERFQGYYPNKNVVVKVKSAVMMNESKHLIRWWGMADNGSPLRLYRVPVRRRRDKAIYPTILSSQTRDKKRLALTPRAPDHAKIHSPCLGTA